MLLLRHENCHRNYEIMPLVDTRMDLGGSDTNRAINKGRKNDVPSRQNLKKRHRGCNLQHKKRLTQTQTKNPPQNTGRVRDKLGGQLKCTQKSVSVIIDKDFLLPFFHTCTKIYNSNIPTRIYLY